MASKTLSRNHGSRHQRICFCSTDTDPEPGHQTLVNVTPSGIAGAQADVLSFFAKHIVDAQRIFDVAVFPSETPPIRVPPEAGKPVITSAEVTALPAATQFEKYTGHKLGAPLIEEASSFSRV